MAWTADLKSILTTALVLGTGSIFRSSEADIPSDGRTYILIRATGGSGNERTHNSAPQPAYEYPGAQIIVGASSSVTAETTAQSAKRALQAVRNQVVGSTYIREIRALQEPFDGGQDKNNRPIVKFNVLGCRRPEGVS